MIEVLSGNGFCDDDFSLTDSVRRLDDKEAKDSDDYFAPIRKLLAGELEQWGIISLSIANNRTDGEHFVDFTALHTDLEDFEANSQTVAQMNKWYEQNICSGVYMDHNNSTLMSVHDNNNCFNDVVYLMRSLEDVSDDYDVNVSYVEITEFIQCHKIRTFRRWFRKRATYDNSWHITFWARD